MNPRDRFRLQGRRDEALSLLQQMRRRVRSPLQMAEQLHRQEELQVRPHFSTPSMTRLLQAVHYPGGVVNSLLACASLPIHILADRLYRSNIKRSSW